MKATTTRGFFNKTNNALNKNEEFRSLGYQMLRKIKKERKGEKIQKRSECRKVKQTSSSKHFNRFHHHRTNNNNNFVKVVRGRQPKEEVY